MNITDTDNLMKLLAEEKEIVDKPDAEELTDARGDLELDHVSSSPSSYVHKWLMQTILPGQLLI